VFKKPEVLVSIILESGCVAMHINKLKPSKVFMLIVSFLLLAIAFYLIYLNVFVIPSKVLVPMGDKLWCRPEVLDDGLLIISGNTSIGDAILCYRFQIPKKWTSVPATVMIMNLGIAGYRAPWYTRGYSVEVSGYRVKHDLGIEPGIWVKLAGGRTGGGKDALYYALALIDGDACKSYNTSLHISVSIRVTEWSLLGPYRTYEFTLLNKTIPLTIEVKQLQTTMLRASLKP